MSSLTPSILIALAAGEARSVTPLMAADGRGGEIVTHVPVAPGDEVGLQVRCSAGARRLLLDVRARVESRQPAEKGHRVRFHWLQPDEPGLAVMATIARELGIMVDRPSPAPQADRRSASGLARCGRLFWSTCRAPSSGLRWPTSS